MRDAVLLEPFLHANRHHSRAEEMILVIRHPGAAARRALRGQRQPLVAHGVRHAVEAVGCVGMPHGAGDVANPRRIVTREDVAILESCAQDVVSFVHDLCQRIELRFAPEVAAPVIACAHSGVARRDLRMHDGAHCREHQPNADAHHDATRRCAEPWHPDERQPRRISRAILVAGFENENSRFLSRVARPG